jgi:hypothetical protein
MAGSKPAKNKAKSDSESHLFVGIFLIVLLRYLTKDLLVFITITEKVLELDIIFPMAAHAQLFRSSHRTLAGGGPIGTPAPHSTVHISEEATNAQMG